jgi:ATP-binding cassette, subfamily B, bacterial
VLDRGRVMEDGSPEELLSAGGEYSSLHASWQESLA